MSGPPRLPPGISLQRAAPDPPQPNLPPGISIKRAIDDSSNDKLRNLPSSIQIQRSNESTDAGMNKLASLGISVSRSESENSSSNSAMEKLSGLGISVSGGPSPAPNKFPRLPPGVSLSGGPSQMDRPSPEQNLQQRLPPGISIQGMSGGQPPPPARSPVQMTQQIRAQHEQPIVRPTPFQQFPPRSSPTESVPRPLPPMQGQQQPRQAPPFHPQMRPPIQRPAQAQGIHPMQSPGASVQRHGGPPLDQLSAPRPPHLVPAPQVQTSPRPINNLNFSNRLPFPPTAIDMQPRLANPPMNPEIQRPPIQNLIKPTNINPQLIPKEVKQRIPAASSPQINTNTQDKSQLEDRLNANVQITQPTVNQAILSNTKTIPTPSQLNDNENSNSNERLSPPEINANTNNSIPAEFQQKQIEVSNIQSKENAANTSQEEEKVITENAQAIISTEKPNDPTNTNIKENIENSSVNATDASQSKETIENQNTQDNVTANDSSKCNEQTDDNQAIETAQGSEITNGSDDGQSGENSTEQPSEGGEQLNECDKQTGDGKVMTGESDGQTGTDEEQTGEGTEQTGEGTEQAGEGTQQAGEGEDQTGEDGEQMEEGGEYAEGDYSEEYWGEEGEDGYAEGAEEWGDYEEDYGYEGEGYEGEEGYEEGEVDQNTQGSEIPPSEGESTQDQVTSDSMAVEKDTPTDNDESNTTPPNTTENSKTDQAVTNTNEIIKTSEKTNINNVNKTPVKSGEVRNFQMLSQQSQGDVSQDSMDVLSADESMDTSTPPPTETHSQPAAKKPSAIPPRPVSQLIEEDSQGSNASHFNLPPGISISSSLNEASNSSTDGYLKSNSPALPPGISISPFKKPSTRPSVDEDAMSSISQDRVSDVSDRVRSPSIDKNPRIGSETNCVICYMRCADRKPRLLSCLHSACLECFQGKLTEARREESQQADEITIDGDSGPFVPEVTCPVCKSSTSESEAIPNYFTEETDQDIGQDEEIQMCGGCEENQANARCVDCEDYLCVACVRAHQKVKITKNHQIIQITSRNTGSQNYKMCQLHPNERLSLYCESCDQLNCRDCQLSEKHRNCKYSYSHQVAPQIKDDISQKSSDIKMKKSHIEESVGILSTKISEVNIKERSLLTQLKDVKDFIVNKIEDRYRELSAEVTKRTRDKRKTLENRKNNLDRSLWQMEHALAFTEHLVNGSVEDTKLLLSKRMVSRQLRKLKRVNQAVNMSAPEMEFKLDLYFQHFHGPNLHSNIDSVLKMICSDIKVSAIPIVPPKPPSPPPPKPAPVPQQPIIKNIAAPVQNSAMSPRVVHPPVTPTRSPAMNVRGGAVTPTRGGHVRQLATPTKSPMRVMPSGNARVLSPAGRGGNMAPRGGMVVGARGVISNRGSPMVRGGMTPQIRGMPASRRGRGRPAVVMGTGAPLIKTQGGMGVSGVRNVQMSGRGMRGRATLIQPGRVAPGMMGRGAARGQVRGGMIGQVRHPSPVMQPIRRGRGAMNKVPIKTQNSGMVVNQYATQNQMYTNAALGLAPAQPPSPQPKQRPKMRGMPIQSNMRTNNMNSPMSSQNINQGPIMVQSRPRQPTPVNMNMPQNNSMGSNNSMNSSGSSSVSLSSWHTPTQAADRPVSPPRAKDNNFKIMLPKMGGNNSVVDIMGNSIIQPSAPTNNLSNPPNLTIPSANIQQSSSPAVSVNPAPMPVHHVTMPAMQRGPQGVGGGVKKEKAPEIIAIDIDDDDDEPEMKKPAMLSSRGSVASNSSSGGGSAVGMDPLAIGRPNHPSQSISKTEFTPIVDPLAADPLATSTITLEPIKKSKGSAGNGPPMVAINGGNLDLKPDNVKLEKQQQQQAGRIEPLKIKLSALPGSVSNTSVSQQRQPQQLDRPGQDQGEWCAVCHDGGDTLYCCDRCPKVYHLYCYIPAMDSEPADDWTCLMCENKEGIFKLSSKVKKGCNLTEQDSALCRRLLLEMYNKWPESVPFRDCADLNFDEYLAKISDPIALDVIKERLSEDSPNQYSSVKMFLADLRKMFRNAFIFNTKESEIYKHAKSMEDKLDSLLTHWAPQFANDPLLDVGPQTPGTSGVKRKNTSPDGSSTRGGGGAKRGRKVKRPQSRASDSVEEIDDLDEVDREQHEYLRALQNSIEDQDPSDTDFTPSGGSKRGRGRDHVCM